jgi:dTDP-glucose pyrophosphorylase
VNAFGIFVLTGRDEVLEIVEKPPDTQPYLREGKLWVSMNLFRFTPDIFEACRRVQPSSRGELELTSAVSLLARSGRAPFRVLFVEAPVLDLTRRDDVAAVERLLEGHEVGF